MRILIIRHGDPNYELDTLTETGWKEARLVAERLSRLDIKDFYVSPLGRAQDTAGCTLEKLGRTAQTLEWLREFAPQIKRPDVNGKRKITWDWLPQDMEQDRRYYEKDSWCTTEIMREADVDREYAWVCEGLDELLHRHGYDREGLHYRAVHANSDTIALFCHFGVECVLLSHLLNISPMPLWHGFCAAPTSVTSIYTEERRKGIVSFRVNEFGSTEHLYVAGETPSFSARFCECYDNEAQRHD